MSITVRERKWTNQGKRKTGKACQVDFSFQTPEGKLIRKRFSFEGTQAAALEWGELARNALRAGKPVPPMYPVEEVKGTEDFASFAKVFLAAKRTENKPSESDSKDSIVHRHLIPFFGTMGLDEIDERKIDGFFVHLLTKVGRKTANNIGIVLRSMLGMAVDYKLIGKAPKVKRLKVSDPEIRAFEPEQARRMVELIDPAWQVMLVVALHTGLRIGELRGLQWADLDLTRRKLHVRRAFAREILGPPKGFRSRMVDLSATAAEALDRHPRNKEWVFCDAAGQHFSQEAVYPALHAASAAAGVGDETWMPGWHTCRHSFVSWLVQAGIPLNVVQVLAGHAKIQQTLRYAHLAPSATIDAVGKLYAVTKNMSQRTSTEAPNTVN